MYIAHTHIHFYLCSIETDRYFRITSTAYVPPSRPQESKANLRQISNQMQHVQHNFSKEVLKEVGQRLEKRERDGERVRERERGERQTETGEANRILRAVRLLNLFAEDKQSQLYNWQRSFVASLSLSLVADSYTMSMKYCKIPATAIRTTKQQQRRSVIQNQTMRFNHAQGTVIIITQS